MNNQKIEKKRPDEPVAPESMAMEGLLREFGENGTAPHRDLIGSIMTEARKTADITVTTVSQPVSVISILKYLLPAAACLAIMGVLIFKSGITLTGKVKLTAESPCLMASTPGGILERAGASLAIRNGMKVNSHDQIKTYASSIAYLQFNDLSRLEISGNSNISYNGTAVIRQPDNSRIKKIDISLQEGAIYGNIVKTSNYGAFTIKTPQGKLSIRQGKFILVNKPNSFYLEVISGAVQFKADHQAKVVKVKPGQVCLIGAGQTVKIVSLNQLNSSMLKQQIIASRQRLTMNESGFEQLLLKLYKKKKADICFKRNKLKNRRIFL
ncbi:MAG: FecR family protein [Victivallaceae bacterium]|nr:FecR family protein [Victivallaceae bacterium]